MKHRPNDVAVEIRLMAELKTIPFKIADDFHNAVVDVTPRYDCTVSDTELIKILAEKWRARFLLA